MKLLFIGWDNHLTNFNIYIVHLCYLFFKILLITIKNNRSIDKYSSSINKIGMKNIYILPTANFLKYK